MKVYPHTTEWEAEGCWLQGSALLREHKPQSSIYCAGDTQQWTRNAGLLSRALTTTRRHQTSTKDTKSYRPSLQSIASQNQLKVDQYALHVQQKQPRKSHRSFPSKSAKRGLKMLRESCPSQNHGTSPFKQRDKLKCVTVFLLGLYWMEIAKQNYKTRQQHAKSNTNLRFILALLGHSTSYQRENCNGYIRKSMWFRHEFTYI